MSPLITRKRRNLLLARYEKWRPPLFQPVVTRRQRFIASLRRIADLQAGSIWRDLKVLLPECAGTLLDVGCGAQPYRTLLGSQVRYFGLDTAASKRSFGYEASDTKYFDGDIWPVSDCSADVVLATEVLEHVVDPRQFLAEARRCLKDGSRLILTTPFAARWHFIPYDYWRFTPTAIELLLREAGFEDISVFARGNELTVACYKVMALMLPLLFSDRSRGLRALCCRVAGVVLSPSIAALAVIGNLSLNGGGGNDCLGYTVTARRAKGGSEKALMAEAACAT